MDLFSSESRCIFMFAWKRWQWLCWQPEELLKLNLKRKKKLPTPGPPRSSTESHVSVGHLSSLELRFPCPPSFRVPHLLSGHRVPSCACCAEIPHSPFMEGAPQSPFPFPRWPPVYCLAVPEAAGPKWSIPGRAPLRTSVEAGMLVALACGLVTSHTMFILSPRSPQQQVLVAWGPPTPVSLT